MAQSGFIAGFVLFLVGLGMITGAYFLEETGAKIVLTIYAVIALSIGTYMISNADEEDKIEQVKKNRKK